jgi:TonB-linked SusC/RagA family outer membrane protein
MITKLLLIPKITLLLLGLSIIGLGQAHSQSITISGTVSDGEGPLPGVSVVVKNTDSGTVTDFDGNYTIDAEANATLVLSYIGYKTRELAVGGKTTLDVTMEEDVSALEEVVVIGYGAAKRKDLTGSIVSVKGEELDKIKPVTFEGGLAAKAAGVQVVQSEGGPGAGFKIRVRGGTSITASSDPLYVIDGFALPGNPTNTSTGLGNSTTSPLASIDPSTIESIEILKDASATAIYGSRGANGVVLITTKKGRKGRTDLNFETFTSVSNLIRPLQLMSGQQYVDYWNEYFPWNPSSTQNEVRLYRDQFGNDLDLNDSRVILTNWQKLISRPAITKNYRMSLSGGSEKSNYSASFSYQDQEGIIKTSDFERYSTALNLDQNITDRLKAGVNMNVGITKSSGVVTAASSNANLQSGVITDAILFPPVQGIVRYENAIFDDDGRVVQIRDRNLVNPLIRLQEGGPNSRKGFNAFGSAYVQFNITDDLVFKTSIRGNFNTNKGQRYFTERFGWGETANGRAFVSNNLGTGLITEQNLNYTKSFGGHNFNVTAVYEQQQNSFEFNNSAATGFDLPGVNLDNLGSATETLQNSSGFSKNGIKSYLARVQYDYKSKYTLNASARYDGSSRFAEGQKYGFFPSVGVAWNVANENFLKDSETINNLRFKASYGETGNTNIGSFRSFAQAGAVGYIQNGNQLVTGAAIEQLANENLTWETTAQLDAGLSLGLFNSRLNVEVDYYEKITTDLLLEVPLPATSGFKTVFKNLGEVSNKGWEFSFNSVNVRTEDFSWASDFNISFNRNEVVDLGGANEFFVTAFGDNQIQNDYVVRVGEPLGSIYGLETDGVYNYGDFPAFDGLSDAQAAEKLRADAAEQGLVYYDVVYELREDAVLSSGQPDRTQYRPGMPKFVDQDGDGVVNDADRTIIGNTRADYFGGFTNNFKYRNFDFSVLMQYSVGNEIYNKNLKQGTALAIPFFNKYRSQADRWTPENPDTDQPVIWGDGDAGITGNAYSDYVEDGSYLRISNLTLGYSLPTDLVEKFGAKSFRLYGAVDNLFVFTEYSGYDPDVSVGNNPLTPGLDVDAYPRSRTFRMGLNLGF